MWNPSLGEIKMISLLRLLQDLAVPVPNGQAKITGTACGWHQLLCNVNSDFLKETSWHEGL